MNNTSRKIFKAFKLKGLSVNAKASDSLCRVLKDVDDVDSTLALVLSEIKQKIDRRDITSSVIDENVIATIITNLTSSDEDYSKESLQLLNAFAAPKIEFDERQRTYKLNPKYEHSMLGTVRSRAGMFRERYNLAYQRCIRSGTFVPYTSSASRAKKREGVFEISPVDSMLGSTGIKVLFGFLTQPVEGQWHLEDLEGLVPLDLSRCDKHCLRSQMFTEGSLAVVEGVLQGGVFCVQQMHMAPGEAREVTTQAFGIDDVFGYGLHSSQKYVQLEEMEERSENSMIIIISDVTLDSPHILKKLQMVFEGFENTDTEPVFILMGSFVSSPVRAAGGRENAELAYNSLADLIAECPRLAAEARFVLVPGPQDGTGTSALPTRAIPEMLTEKLRKTATHVAFASNPCRLRFYTQEIVLSRYDLLKKLQRNKIWVDGSGNRGGGCDDALKEVEKETHADIAESIVDTVVRQGHLCPLPQSVQPITWELDHTLRITPLPHLLVMADKCESFSIESHGCGVVNPGSFASDSSFVVYRPASREIELSGLP